MLRYGAGVDAATGFRRNVYMKTSVFVTSSELRSQGTELPRRRLRHVLQGEQLPLAHRVHDFYGLCCKNFTVVVNARSAMLSYNSTGGKESGG
jgi:hypothetical protein